jgi:hypothetical protein
MPVFLPDLPALTTVLLLASAGACPPATPVKIDVNIAHDKNPIEKSISSFELTRRMQENGDSFAEAGWWTGGINSSKLKVEYSMPYRQITGKGGQVCFMPTSFTYKLTYENQIYIAEDFKLQGCRYSVTLAHERTHERMDMMVIKQFESKIRKALQKAATGIRPAGPMPARNAPAAIEQMAQGLLSAIEPVMAEMNEERRKKHAQIDNYESYMRDTALCPNQFPRPHAEKGQP